MTNELVACELPAPPAAFLAEPERRDPLAPLRGVLLGVLLGGSLWLDAWLVVRALF